jgi:CMP-N-acetylneuraminic acid synthetase
MATDRLKVVALLPMKANSARVIGKNFREFNGKPLFRWILDTLLSIEEVNEVVINTDARHLLAEKGLKEGPRIRIRDRKPEICGDFVSMNRVIGDDVANVKADIFIMTHTTNPLLGKDTILRALNTFLELNKQGRADSLFTVNRIQTRLYRGDGSAVNHDPNNLVRTQDLEPLYEENSNLYIFTPQSFAKTETRIGRSPTMFETPRLESIDIDDEADWVLALNAAQYLSTSETEVKQ